MTVGELVEKLSCAPQDFEVRFYYDGGRDHSSINSVAIHPGRGGFSEGPHVLLAEESEERFIYKAAIEDKDRL